MLNNRGSSCRIGRLCADLSPWLKPNRAEAERPVTANHARSCIRSRAILTASIRREHLSPVKAGLRLLVRGTIHGHTTLAGRDIVAVHVLSIHGVDVASIRLRATHDRRSHATTIAVSGVVHASHAGGARELVLVLMLVAGHTIHAILNGNHAKGVNHAVAGHAAHLVHVTIGHTSSLLRLGVLFDVRLRVGKVGSSGGVATADGALLKVALQDITARKGVAAENTHVGTVTSVAQKMALQVLGVQIGLGAVRARKLAIGILDGNDRVLCSRGTGGGSSRATRGAGQDTSATLRAYHMSRLLRVAQDTVVGHERTRPVGRADAILAHETTGRHGTQDRRSATTSRRGSDGLRVRVRRSSGGAGHHGLRSAVAGVRRVGVLSHRVHAASSTGLGALRVAGRQVVRRVWRVRRTSARSVRVATVEGLHARGGRLQRRQRLRQRRTWLTVMRRERGRRRVTVRVRGSVYTIGGIGRVIHALARKNASRKISGSCFLGETVVEGERQKCATAKRADVDDAGKKSRLCFDG